MRGRRQGSSYGFLMFSSAVKCTLAVLSAWKELPRDTIGSRMAVGTLPRAVGWAKSRWTGHWLREPENQKKNEIWN